ncbi:endonuclease-reverse transcriptase [Clonorchis sinensis]|uniref:Endonuclease-reverse transcriptase n=1 Tax=Clonorchis sinensis TaxID=79923 RepID=G7YUX9_CLOSI|nr:endonuclease-reverse transcriptase [Clonorchis sinensis]
MKLIGGTRVNTTKLMRCLRIDATSLECSINSDRLLNCSAVAPFWCLTAMPPKGSTRVGILPGCSSLVKGSREAEHNCVQKEQYLNWNTQRAKKQETPWSRINKVHKPEPRGVKDRGQACTEQHTKAVEGQAQRSRGHQLMRTRDKRPTNRTARPNNSSGPKIQIDHDTCLNADGRLDASLGELRVQQLQTGLTTLFGFNVLVTFDNVHYKTSGASAPVPTSTQERLVGLTCEECGKWCKSKAGLVAHHRVHDNDSVGTNMVAQLACADCSRLFPTKIGLSQHRRHAHPTQHNADKLSRVKHSGARWSQQESQSLLRLANNLYPSCETQTPMIISYRGICFPQSAKAVIGLGLSKVTVSDLCLLAIVGSLRTYDTFMRGTWR